MSSNEREQQLNSVLAQLRELYARLRQLLPEGFGADHIPTADEQKREIVTAIHFLLLNARRVDSLLKGASLDGLAQPMNTELLQWFRERLIPERSEFQKIFLELIGLPNIEIDLDKVHPRTEQAPIWNILVSGLDFWKLNEGEEFTTEELDSAEHFLYSSFFEPDQWMQNLEELQPVAGEDADRRVPSNIRVRVRELYRSFVLGNHLAAIALTRAMLEYAIVEHAPRLGIIPYFTDNRGRNRTRRLRELVDEISVRMPNLNLSMETIVEAGNRTLHPEQQDRLVLSPDRLHDLALDSINAIRDVVEQLYVRRQGNA